MKLNPRIVCMAFTTALMSLAAINVSASPYENLTYALNEHVLVKDLRTQCEIDPAISDEKVKAAFINSEVNHHPLSAAASALKAGKTEQYQQLLNTVRCPDLGHK